MVLDHPDGHREEMQQFLLTLHKNQDFLGGAVDKNPASAGDMGSIPGLGRCHTLWSN